MFEYILTFTSPDASLEKAGGKGANLARLSQAGFPVPPGFIVSTRAYQDFVNAYQLQQQILAWTQNLAIDQPDEVERISQAIYALFDQASLPEEMGQQIITAYHTLENNQPAVAVRSSATAEDLPGFAFAGQQDTFLNIAGDHALLDAVKRCWASLWTARAITYRARNDFAQEDAALAVVVQKMIESEVSGVMFTANPVTGKRQEFHIDASYGLGEALVSGQVEPDHYVVDPITNQIAEHRIGSKQVVISEKVGGGTQRMELDPDLSQALPDRAILELALFGRRVAAQFSVPQDIEWAWAKGDFFLLQSRPITSLYPLPLENQKDAQIHIYFNFNAIQGVPDPLTPLGIDALRLVFSGVLKTFGIQQTSDRVFPEAGSRLFLDFGDLPADPVLRKIVLNFLESVEPGERDILLQLVADGKIQPRQVLTPGLALRLMLTLSPLLFSTLVRLLQYRTARDQVNRQGELYLRRIEDHLAAAPGTVNEALAVCLQSIQQDLPLAQHISIRAMPVGLAANQMVMVLDGWLTHWLGEPQGAAMPLLRSLPGNVTVEMNLRLWAVAQAIRADETAAEVVRSQPAERLTELFQQSCLPEIVQQVVAQFLQQDGMRGVAEIDLGKPRWQEDPTPIFRTLKSYLQLSDPNLAPDRIYKQGAEQAEQLIADYAKRIRKTRWGWLRSKMFLAIARRVRALSSLREVPLFYLAQGFALYRQALLHAGRALVEQGSLDDAEDIFFIPLQELKEWVQSGGVDLKAAARSRRAAFRFEYRRKQMPRVLLSTGETFYNSAVTTESEGQMTGMAVSPGVIEGNARVILDPKGAHLQPGEILVCTSTDPGWTPLFLTAGGLVMEIGGLMTHGSVVAREFGLPAVVGVREATTRIKTGQRIRVDGTHGWVISF